MKMRSIVRIAETASEWAGRMAYPLIITVMIMIALEVVLRYGFSKPTVWVWDVSVQVAAAFALLGGAYALLHRAHVSMDVLYTKFSPKVKVIADLVCFVFTFLFCTALIWHGGKMAWKSVTVMETTRTAFDPPIYPLKVFLVVASCLLLLQAVANLIQDLTATTPGGETDE